MNPKDLEEKQLSSEYIFKGRIINLRVDKAALPNGPRRNAGGYRASRRGLRCCSDRSG